MSHEVQNEVDRADSIVYGMQFKIGECRDWLRARVDPPVELIDALIKSTGELQTALERCKVERLKQSGEVNSPR